LLQSGLGGTIGEAGGGSGRPVSQLNQQEGCGQKENRNTQFTRVVRIEVHQQGSPSWSRAMRGEDHVYNFSVEGNENYFANGILVHNCKHSPAAGWRRIIESCKGFRYGFDATPWSDNEDRNAMTRMLFRNRQYEIKRSDIGDSLADAYLQLSDATDLNLKQKIDDNIDRLFVTRRRYMRISDDELKRMCAWESLVDIGICQNRERNNYAINYAVEHLDMQTLILIPRITLGEDYEKRIPGSLLVHSKIGKKQRKAAMEEFKAGNLRTMIATSLADEGLDLPNVDLLIMVSGGRSSQKTIQRASRALRKTETKNCATIVDFSDKFHPIGAFHAKKRMTCYRELGCIFQ
jgi:superfamily II DNA or RNA helicase